MDWSESSLKKCMSCFKMSPDTADWIKADDLGWSILECWVPPPHSTEQYSKWTFVLTFILWLCFSPPWADFLRFQEGLSVGQGNRHGLKMRKSCWQLLWHCKEGQQSLPDAPRPRWALAYRHRWPVQKHKCTNIRAAGLYCRGNALHGFG